MILFDLRCSAGHDFEAWFKDGAAYEEQVQEAAVSCPLCGDRQVAKALMAPALSSGQRVEPERAAKAVKLWRKVQDHIEKNFDHVGTGFAEEARRMHYGEADKRNIYGEASKEDAKELRDEGIEVGQVPWLPRHDG